MPFDYRMTKKELVAALVLLAVITASPALAELFPDYDRSWVEFGMAAVMFFVTLAVFRRFLIEELRAFTRSLWSSIVSVFAGAFLYISASVLISALAGDALYERAQNPITLLQLGMLERNPRPFVSASALLWPLSRETAFLGGVFGPVYNKNKALAWALSLAVFSAAQVWLSVYYDRNALVFALGYLPFALVAAYAYRQSSSIWAAVFYEIMLNSFMIYTMIR